MLSHRPFSHRATLVAAAAVVMSYISAKFIFNGSVFNILPWGILSFAASYLATSKREAWKLGTLFGFVVSYLFLWFDNTDTKTLAHVVVLIPLIIVPALFGALCGFLAAWLGWVLRPKHKKQPGEPA
jgi:apolipoprotein N-acyltransferase